MFTLLALMIMNENHMDLEDLCFLSTVQNGTTRANKSTPAKKKNTLYVIFMPLFQGIKEEAGLI